MLTFLSLRFAAPGPRLKDVLSRASRVHTSVVPEEIAKPKSKEEVLEALEKAGPAIGTFGLEVYVRVAKPQVTRWEQEIDARIESAQNNLSGFLIWSSEVVSSILTLRNSEIPNGLPLPRDPVSDPLFENEAVMAAYRMNYRERQLIRKIREAKSQYLPDQDEIDRQIENLLEQPTPVINRSDA